MVKSYDDFINDSDFHAGCIVLEFQELFYKHKINKVINNFKNPLRRRVWNFLRKDGPLTLDEFFKVLELTRNIYKVNMGECILKENTLTIYQFGKLLFHTEGPHSIEFKIDLYQKSLDKTDSISYNG